jgi:hypothetical protein
MRAPRSSSVANGSVNSKRSTSPMPLDAGAHCGLVGAFSIIESPDPLFPDVAYVDCVAGQMFLEKPEEIRRTKLLINHLRTKALDKQKSIARLAATLDPP